MSKYSEEEIKHRIFEAKLARLGAILYWTFNTNNRLCYKYLNLFLILFFSIDATESNKIYRLLKLPMISIFSIIFMSNISKNSF